MKLVQHMYNIAFELCTGSFDRIDMARIRGQNSILKAKGEYSWFLDFHTYIIMGIMIKH